MLDRLLALCVVYREVSESGLKKHRIFIVNDTRPLRTAIVGYGVSGRVFHAPFLTASPEYDLRCVVTASPLRRAEAVAQVPSAQVLASVDALIARKDDIDVVVLATPPSTHLDLVDRLLDPTTAVVIDKPFAATVEDARAIVDLAAARESLITVFQNRRWDGDFLTVADLVSEGALGDVRRFESRFEWWQPRPVPSWKTTIPVAAGGGILYDLGSHLVDQALQLFGPVREIHAEVCMRGETVAADDDAFLALTHEGGVISHLWMSSVAAHHGPRFRVLGADAAYVSHGLDGQEAALAAGTPVSDPLFGVTPKSGWGVVGVEGALRPHPTHRGDYGRFYDELAAAIRTRSPLPVDPRSALRVMEILNAAHQTHHQIPDRERTTS